MKKIKIKDKTFIRSITSREINQIIKTLADRINNDLQGKEVLFLPILNGSFIFAADLIREIKIPGTVSFVKLSSYKADKSQQNIQSLIGLNEDLKDKCIIIIEDIIDTGSTIAQVVNDLKSKKVAEIKIATMLLKSGIYAGNIVIDYIGKEIENNFVVGYGLDYDGFGRNFKDIYKMTE